MGTILAVTGEFHARFTQAIHEVDRRVRKRLTEPLVRVNHRTVGNRPPTGPRFPGMTPSAPHGFLRFAPLIAAEAAAEAVFGAVAGVEPADLEQAVWLRMLEGPGPPGAGAAGWLRAAVRAEARAARRRARREVSYDADRRAGPAVAASAEKQVLREEGERALRAAVGRLPGRCPQLLSVLMSGSDPTYREISRELGISQGSLGPLRSRCLGCLRVMLGSVESEG